MPDRPLRVGVAGLGRAFTLMLSTLLQDPRVRLVAACDPREPARSQFSRDFSAPVYSSIEGLAANEEVEAIYIASPHQFHAEQTRVAALHGKHVLVEKPMALSLAECDQMIADCARGGVRLIVGHCHSFDTPYLRARDLIDEGGLGRVRMIHALNYTDFLYRPRRPEELQTAQGGGVVYSQAAHQVDIVRLMAGSRVTQVRAVTGAWDPDRPTEGAYCALLWFADDTFASITYSGYGHFDSDEWCDWIGEMGQEKSSADYGAARRRLCASGSPEQEAHLKAAATYGGPAYKQPMLGGPPARHQHFGPVLVSCEHADVRPTPTGVWVYADSKQVLHPLSAPDVPRAEVVDELYGAVIHNVQPLHNGMWARETLAVCLALLESAANKKDIQL